MKYNQIAWLGKPENRILNIRAFRKYIDTLSLSDAISATQSNWNASPRINKNEFNLANVEEWPTPWDLFSQPVYCSNAQILGAFYTLVLSDHAREHAIEIVFCNDAVFGEIGSIIVDRDKLPPLDESSITRIIAANDISHKLGD